MKIISFNIWGGRKFDKLIHYFGESDADIYCLQEVTSAKTHKKMAFKGMCSDVFQQIQQRLPDHKGYFVIEEQNFEVGIDFGKCIFIRKNIKVHNSQDLFVFRHKNARVGEDNATMGRSLQYAEIEHNNQIYTIAHMHGLWNGKGKTDTQERMNQARIAKEFLSQAKGKIIFMGDFNLLPDNESLKVMEENMINLIKTNNITTTRTALYNKPIPWADYTLISKDVNTISFNVPEVNCSDHRPMVLECE